MAVKRPVGNISGGTVNAMPTKRFFTANLTRDIELQDAILDLLDNCVDGINRHPARHAKGLKPYKGFFAKISFSATSFLIEDNCGGIPLDRAREYAFRFGRDDSGTENVHTVGVYGIGMKRAIFKMGNHATIKSQFSARKSFRVEVPSDWVSKEIWNFPIQDGGKILSSVGTSVLIDNLHENIVEVFSKEAIFRNLLVSAVRQYYSLIIDKGFTVTVNGVLATSESWRLLVPKTLQDGAVDRSSAQLLPYTFSATVSGVDVELVCGFYAPIVSEDGDEFSSEIKSKADFAGWTVVCNDRIVLWNDKTAATAWGIHGVPRFHAQFRTFAGIVLFKSKDPSKLPMQTTKRGIDANSEVYQQVQQFLITGTRLFTDFTNKWKGDPRVSEVFADTVQESPTAILRLIKSKNLSRKVRNQDSQAFSPTLPMPPAKNPIKVIRFSRPTSEIRKIATSFDLEEADASGVGDFCFGFVLDRAKK